MEGPRTIQRTRKLSLTECTRDKIVMASQKAVTGQSQESSATFS
ncbi:hypothetical protein OKW46_004404 [Paraburkholderia sp. WSM4179]|nr:hypothetical protein [Paraburkholderia sp. WSM4179]